MKRKNMPENKRRRREMALHIAQGKKNRTEAEKEIGNLERKIQPTSQRDIRTKKECPKGKKNRRVI